jgi:uncharacterized membrane protein
MNSLGWLHLVSATMAIVFGTIVVVNAKGTRKHRWGGRAYVACRVLVCLSAFAIYNLHGSFGPFHWAAVGETFCLTSGMAPLARRRENSDWKIRHAFYMTWSYVGLLVALAGEITTRVPGAPFGLVVWSSVAIVVFGGSRVIKKHFGRARRPPASLPEKWGGAGIAPTSMGTG